MIALIPFCTLIQTVDLFKPAAAHAWFLEIALVCMSVCLDVCVCVCVSPPPRPLITSGMIWCDIDHVQLIKQVLRLFPALITLYNTYCR